MTSDTPKYCEVKRNVFTTSHTEGCHTVVLHLIKNNIMIKGHILPRRRYGCTDEAAEGKMVRKIRDVENVLSLKGDVQNQ